MIGPLEDVAGALYAHIANPSNWLNEQEFNEVTVPGVYWVVAKSGNQYLKLKGPCPLLDIKTNRCTAHHLQRPLGCGLPMNKIPICPEY
jgi:Fe-S-cluster containining protein